MGILVVLVALIVAGCAKSTEFDRDKILAASEQNAIPQLEKDYDTETEQVRHISWGKLNYYPEEITVMTGKKVKLIGDVTRLQGCFRSLTIPDLKVAGQFTERNNVIEFTPARAGTFGFGCSMGMGNGVLVVK